MFLSLKKQILQMKDYLLLGGDVFYELCNFDTKIR